MNTFLCFLICCFSVAVHSQEWESRSPVPAPGRDDGAAFSIEGYGYLVTGNHGGFDQSNRLWRFDPATDSWTEKSAFPGIPRQYAGVFALNDYGYIIGGYAETSVPLNDVWKYDPSTDEWTQLNDFPGLPRWSMFAVSAGGYGFIGTGTTLTAFLSDAWKYEPENDSWSQLTDFPGGARRETVAFALGEKLFVGQGNATMGTPQLKADFYSLNTVSGNWSAIADFPGEARWYGTAVSTGLFGYAGTGYNAAGTFLSDMYRFNPGSESWEMIGTFPGNGIRGMSAFAIGKTPYLLTGLKTGPERTSEMWKLNGEPDLEIEPACYPNPSAGTVVVRAEQGAVIRFFTLQGALVKQTETKELATVFENLPPGTYMLQIESKGKKHNQLLIVC